MENKKSIGLPGGPNEFLKEITQHISVEGYKRYSKDVNNPYNIIESGNITMEDVDFPVKGTDNLGNEQIMMPGMNYQFPGDSVLEVPMAQGGKEVEEKSVWGLVKEMAKIPGANISNLLGVMGIPANLVAEATESLTGRGDGQFNFMDAIPSFATPGSDDEIFTFTNQNGTPVKNIAGLEDAEGNPLVENPVGAFITNLATDPSTYVGAGVVKNLIKKGIKKSTKNITKKVVENTPKVVDNVTPSWSRGVPNYGNSPEGIQDALSSMKLQGKYLDEIGFNVNDVIAPNVINHGNKFGRQIAEVALPNGQSQLFYKSSGLAGKKGIGKGGTTEGLWQPYGGHASANGTNNWFIKDIGYENFYDSNSFKGIANKLDEIESGWDMSEQVLKSKLKYGGQLPKAQDGNGEYKVASGDTFYGIANKNKISWDALKEANPNLDYDNLKLDQSIVIPNKIDRSPPIPKEGLSKNSNVLDYNALSNYLVDTRGGTSDTWGQLADTIAYHESSPWSRMDPKAKQYKGGPGRGLFQFEGESFNTALKRYKNVAGARGFTIKDSIVNAKSADELSSEDQYALFLANLIESKTKLSDFADGNISSLDVWLTGHKNVEADGDRASFLESKTAAEKEGIKNGYKTFQEGGEKYIVSAGDNLSKIANKYKTSVDELVRLNDISDPNMININQELVVPKIAQDSTLNKYTVKSGDTLGKLATKYNTSVTQLAKLNNIKDVNKINVNQELILPDSYREEKPLKEKSWYNVDDIQKNNNKINDLTDENIIINSQLLNNPNQAYVVIDKKTQRLKLYRGDEVDLDFEVLTGANDGDAQTVTNVIDYNKDGITTEADKRGGKYKTDWMAGNRSTGAGIYTINQSAPTSEDRYQNAPSFNLLNESGIQVGTSIHGTPGFRNKFFDDGNLENNSASNGCINGKCSDLQALYNMNLPTGTPVFILPEDEGNSFQQVDGKAVMRMSNKNRKDYLEYTDLRDNKQEGQGGNYSTSTLSYKPIRAKLDKELFEEKVYSAFDFNDDDEFNNTTQPFITALEKNKKDIMLAAQIPGDVYNQIAKMAFGIYGTESNFGDTHSGLGNLGRAATKYFDREGSSSPDVVSKYNTYDIKGDNNSVGYTQIRWSQLNDKEKSALKSFDITSNKDFLNPEKSAIATATILGIRYNEQLTADQKKDVWKNLPSKWNNRSNYASRVKRNSRYLQFEQLDRLEKGGEIENNIMYKNYINGVYEGSKMQSKAEKVYDKLNRLHYRDAKAKQMTPANYVLTYITG